MACHHGAPVGNICAGCETDDVYELVEALNDAPLGVIPVRAIMELISLLAPDPRGDGWRRKSRATHARHGVAHFVQRQKVAVDADSGFDPYIHAAARALFAREVAMDAEKEEEGK